MHDEESSPDGRPDTAGTSGQTSSLVKILILLLAAATYYFYDESRIAKRQLGQSRSELAVVKYQLKQSLRDQRVQMADNYAVTGARIRDEVDDPLAAMHYFTLAVVIGKGTDKVGRWSLQADILAHDSQLLRVRSEPGMKGAVFDERTGHVLLKDAAGNTKIWDPDADRDIEPASDQAAREAAAASEREREQPIPEAVLQAIEHERPVSNAVFDQANNRVYTFSTSGTGSGQVTAWDAGGKDAPRPVPVWPKIGHGGIIGDVRGVDFDPDARFMVTWTATGSVRVWDLDSGYALTKPMRHRGSLAGVDVDAARARILTLDTDGVVRVWQVRSLPDVIDAGDAHASAGQVRGVVLDGTGRRAVTWTREGDVRVWDVTTAQPVGAPIKHPDMCWGATFGSSSDQVLTWGADHTVRTWDVEHGRAAGERAMPDLSDLQGNPSGAALSPDLERLATWAPGHDGVRVWNVATAEPAFPELAHDTGARGAVFGPRGRQLLTWTERFAYLWDAERGQLIGQPMPHDTALAGAAFSRDVVVTFTQDRVARIWDAASAQPLSPPLPRAGTLGVVDPDKAYILAWTGSGATQERALSSGQSKLDESVARRYQVETGTRLDALGHARVMEVGEWRRLAGRQQAP